MRTKWNVIIWVIVAYIVLSRISSCTFTACSSDKYDDFEKAMQEGNLTEAQGYLNKMNTSSQHNGALQLIKAYLSVDEPDKAINVYENITSDHVSRYEIQWSYKSPDDYEQKACKLLREYLISHAEYDKAWDYYPLDYDDENYIGNAQCRFAWLSDVVSKMRSAGKQDQARRFVDENIHWFVTYVDGCTSDDEAKTKSTFGSTVVRQKLYDQIDNVIAYEASNEENTNAATDVENDVNSNQK
mgnify:CR=1 FL=1